MSFFCALIDWGHDGTDEGGHGNGLFEKDLVYALTMQLRDSLCGLPIRVVLSREERINISNTDVGDAAVRAGANYALSIHANTSKEGARGAMTFYWPGNETGRLIARRIANTMPNELQPGDVRVADASWPNCKAIIRAIPCTANLCEVGFMTHAHDAAFLASATGQALVVCALRAGVIEAWRLSETDHGC